ncbi:hypothetical protein [Escherichia coli]|uniref:hypothetical protein n=1 Tax=Escherichia coli TaxID=562 RepID=UPI003EE8439B
MAEPLCMASWHAAVLDALKKLKWINDADTYPERVTQLVTPAVFLAVDGWDAKSNADGQMTVVLSAALWVLVDRAGEPDKEKRRTQGDKAGYFYPFGGRRVVALARRADVWAGKCGACHFYISGRR